MSMGRAQAFATQAMFRSRGLQCRALRRGPRTLGEPVVGGPVWGFSHGLGDVEPPSTLSIETRSVELLLVQSKLLASVNRDAWFHAKAAAVRTTSQTAATKTTRRPVVERGPGSSRAPACGSARRAAG